MEPEDRPAFDQLLAELFGAIDKPLTDAKAAGFWKGLSKMALVEFVRTQELLLAELQEGAAPKNFTVHDVWEARKRLRARAERSHAAPAPPKWEGDAWLAYANQKLLALVMRAASGWGARTVRAGFGAYQQAEMTVLLAARNDWCRVMREEASQTDGTVDIETQRGMWNACMAKAHDTIGRPFKPREFHDDGSDHRPTE